MQLTLALSELLNEIIDNLYEEGLTFEEIEHNFEEHMTNKLINREEEEDANDVDDSMA